MVDTKDQSNAIVYAMLFVDTVDTKIKACNALNCVCYVCRHYWHEDTGVHSALYTLS